MLSCMMGTSIDTEWLGFTDEVLQGGGIIWQ